MKIKITENRTINLVRCVPPELHTAMKMLAAKNGTTLIIECVAAMKKHVKSNE